MTVPASVLVECPQCKAETLHEVLSGRMGGRSVSVLESTVKCRDCGHVHHVTVKASKPVEVPVVISWLKESSRGKLVLGPDEVLSVGDEVMCGELPTMVTSIESKGARKRSAKASDIDTVWAKRFDKLKILFSVNAHGRTFSDFVMAVPDEEFCIGDIMEFNKRPVVIHSIRIQERTIRKGSALARDIVRVYGAVVRRTVQRGGGSKD
ncbi:MAG: HVO_0476 family zinc finger protein [Candidatus Thermoplasmatota archaeon]